MLVVPRSPRSTPSAAGRITRSLSGGLLVATGLVLGIGGFISSVIMGGMSMQQRTQLSNFRVNRAIDLLSGVGTAHADVPASCGGAGGCGGCGCGE